jgi:hypothetical protein
MRAAGRRATSRGVAHVAFELAAALARGDAAGPSGWRRTGHGSPVGRPAGRNSQRVNRRTAGRVAIAGGRGGRRPRAPVWRPTVEYLRADRPLASRRGIVNSDLTPARHRGLPGHGSPRPTLAREAFQRFMARSDAGSARCVVACGPFMAIGSLWWRAGDAAPILSQHVESNLARGKARALGPLMPCTAPIGTAMRGRLRPPGLRRVAIVPMRREVARGGARWRCDRLPTVRPAPHRVEHCARAQPIDLARNFSLTPCGINQLVC